MYPGILIAVDGIDGAGKSSLIPSLKNELESISEILGFSGVFQTSDTGTGMLPSIFKEMGSSKELTREKKNEFYSILRLCNFNDFVIPALNEGKIVLSDRSVLSSVAYCAPFGTKEFDSLIKFESSIYSNMGFGASGIISPTCPDLSFILDVDPYRALKRRTDELSYDDRGVLMYKGVQSFSERCDHLSGVRKNYIDIYRSRIDNCFIVDANESKQCVLDDVRASLVKFFNLASYF